MKPMRDGGLHAAGTARRVPLASRRGSHYPAPRVERATMNTREEIEALVRSAYAARMAGDVDDLMTHFSDGAVFSLAGSAATSPVPMVAGGKAAIRETLRRLVDGFEFKEMRVVSILVDGPQAAVHWHARVRATGSGYEAETDILDLVRVENGSIVSFLQFADTALINRMLEL